MIINLVIFPLISYGDFQAYARQKKHKTYILKPESGCQGRGIWVTKNIRDIKPHEHMLCQQYISRVSIKSQFNYTMLLHRVIIFDEKLQN